MLQIICCVRRYFSIEQEELLEIVKPIPRMEEVQMQTKLKKRSIKTVVKTPDEKEIVEKRHLSHDIKQHLGNELK